MKVHIITHAKHNKGGNTASNYDGPLTLEGHAMIEALKPAVDELLPRCDAVYRGTQIRHIETAEALGITEAMEQPSCGHDESLFALAEDGNETILTDWIAFLDEQKSNGVENLLIVSSRFYPMLMVYTQKGGAKKLGNLQHFANASEMLMNWPGSAIPPFAQAVITEWEY
jgi:phosphohistidine phosphatase SixA